MNCARFKPAVDGACAHVAQRCRFVRRNQAARLGASIASLLWRDERPVDDYYLTLFHREPNALESFFHARLLIVFFVAGRLVSALQSARPDFLVFETATVRLAVKVRE